MIPRAQQRIEHLLAATPGWLLLGCGVAILAAVVLMPGWLAQRQAAWQCQVMGRQVEQLSRQHERYQQFHAALKDDDPVLLERLAYTQLRYKAIDATLLAPADTLEDSVSAYLAQAMPEVGVDIAPLSPINTRLVRLTTGSHRIALALAGLLCVLAGLWSSPVTPRR